MKLFKPLLLTVLSGLFFISCSTENHSGDQNSENNDVVKENCTYTYTADSTSFKWTAYKFTIRTGVSGTFNTIVVSNTKESDHAMGVLVGAEFSINTSSINSGNLERDPKVIESFFGSLTNSETITGKINSINDGETVVTITMNDVSVDIVGNISEVGSKVILIAKVDMNDFNGMGAVESLNNKCDDLHTGEDGVSKLWPDITIEVSTVLNKECK